MDTSTSGRHREKRKRSRSPYRARDQDRDVKRSRSRSRYRRKAHEHRSHRDAPSKAKVLPFRSRHLHKHDLEAFRPLLADYLDLQKHLRIGDLGEDEVKGRWKSFLHKWNAGELAEGWYDPEVKRKAEERALQSNVSVQGGRGGGQRREAVGSEVQPRDEDSEDADDDGYGPALPGTARRSGPAIPNRQDLQHRQEFNEESRSSDLASLREARKADRKLQAQRLEDLAPRADPGTRERQLEKKREVAASNRAFADAKEGGADEVGEGDLMGEDGVDGYKRQMRENDRAKNEREVRKEEVLRARAAEREERVQKQRVKEERTMGMLRELARQRFGGGDEG